MNRTTRAGTAPVFVTFNVFVRSKKPVLNYFLNYENVIIQSGI